MTKITYVCWLLPIYCDYLNRAFTAISSYSNFKASKLFTAQVETGDEEFHAWACEPGSFFKYTSSGTEGAPEVLSSVQVLSEDIWCSADVERHVKRSQERTPYSRDWKISDTLFDSVTLRPIVGALYSAEHSRHTNKISCLDAQSVWFPHLNARIGHLHAEQMESHKRHFLLYNLSGICRPALKTSVLLWDPVPWSPEGLSFSFIFLLQHIWYV